MRPFPRASRGWDAAFLAGVRAAVVGAMAFVSLGDPARAACRAVEGQARFVVTGEVARDRVSGLEWRRCALGATWDGTGCSGAWHFLGLDAAEAAAKELGEGWRLPDVKELYELLDEGCGRPAIDTTVFPDVATAEEDQTEAWTTTPVGLAELWYFVDLASGVVDGHSRGYSLAVRLVRRR